MSHYQPPLCLECGRPHWEGACHQGPSLKERIWVKVVALINSDSISMTPIVGRNMRAAFLSFKFGRNGHE